MVMEKQPCALVKMKNAVWCNNDIYQNVVREAHKRMNSEQARALRDVAGMSTLWSSTIHITDNHQFVEAFFVNMVVVSKRIDMDVVNVDDTACSNAFMLPVVVMLVRDASSNTHSVAWGIPRERTVESFERFFRFVSQHCTMKVFMCDRCHSQGMALKSVFGEDKSSELQHPPWKKRRAKHWSELRAPLSVLGDATTEDQGVGGLVC